MAATTTPANAMIGQQRRTAISNRFPRHATTGTPGYAQDGRRALPGNTANLG
jgi:hypothetical protein